MHTERLCRLLQARGYRVEAFEMHTRRLPPPRFPFAYHYGRAGSTMLRFLMSCSWHRPEIIHFHLSAARRVLPLFPVIVLLARFFKVLLTVHSGSFERRVSEASRTEKNWLGRGFRAVAAVVAVSPGNRDALLSNFGVLESRIHLIPAFLHFPNSANSASAASSSGRRVFLASGCATPIYFWDGLLEAVQGLTILDELVLVFYHRYDQPYFDEVLDKAKQLAPFAVTIRRDLSAEDFGKELARASIFVRPTLTDGDSIAVREALALGKRVVASDAVARPSGCVIFRTRDVSDLREKLTQASAMSNVTDQAAVPDFSEPILGLYQRLLRDSQ